MENEEIKKTEAAHNVSIALIQKDIQYIRESIAKIDTTIAIFDKNFARKEEVVEFEKRMIAMDIEMNKKIEMKANQTDLDSINTTLSRINWLLIAGVVTALLSLVVNVEI